MEEKVIQKLSDIKRSTELLRNSLILKGDSREAILDLQDDFYSCCVTSPPYWGKRDYGYNGQIGAEKDLSDYIANIVSVFSNVRKKLKEDGTLWLNIGDSYTSGNRNRRAEDKKNPAREMTFRPPTPNGLKPKDLIGIPWRIAFALQEEGWYLRSDIIWYKPNCQPESVKDRPTVAHEYIFLFSKSEKYLYNYEKVQEKANGSGNFRNKRTVWSVNTEPIPDAHFATFPEELIKPIILAATNESDYVLDPFFGSGTVGVVCEKLNRFYHGIELKDEYLGIANRRIYNIQCQTSFPF